jgi:hypothetical protein
MRSIIAKASFLRRNPGQAQPPRCRFEDLPPACLELTSWFCAAENALKEEAKKPKYSLSLLSIVSSGTQSSNIRLAAALAFKNFIRHNYVVRAIPS